MMEMEATSVQKWHFADLPPEIVGEVVARLSAKDVESLASTSSYFRDAACANALWIRRCKDDFGVKVDPAVAEENGPGSVYAFYLLILDNLGQFLGPLKRKNLEHYSGLYQLVHDGKLGVLCLQWVPPPPRLGLQLPMNLQKFFSVSLAELAIKDGKKRCNPPSKWYQAVYKVLDKFNDSSAIVVKNETDQLHIHTLDAADYTREPNKFRNILDTFAQRDLGVDSVDVILTVESLDQGLLVEKAMRSYHNRDLYILERSLSDLLVAPSEESRDLVPIEPGLFKGDYGCHGTELIHLSYSNEGSDGVMFSGMKVTGDPNVPSGRNSFKGNVTIDSLRIPIYEQATFESLHLCCNPEIDTFKSQFRPTDPAQPFRLPEGCHRNKEEYHGEDPKFCLSRFRCVCKVASNLYNRPQWIGGNFVVFDKDFFGVIFIGLRSISYFHRVPSADISSKSMKELDHLEIVDRFGHL